MMVPGSPGHWGAARPDGGGAHVNAARLPLPVTDVEGDEAGENQNNEKRKGAGGGVVVNHGEDLNARHEKDQRSEDLAYEREGRWAVKEGGGKHLDGDFGSPRSAFGLLGRGRAIEVRGAQGRTTGMDGTVVRDSGPIDIGAGNVGGGGAHALTLLARCDTQTRHYYPHVPAPLLDPSASAAESSASFHWNKHLRALL